MIILASDFSYIERVIIEVWVWLWFIQRVWSTDKFSSLRWSKICNFDLKSVITLLILLMLPAQAIFDGIWTYLRYTEGFYVNQNYVVTKPAFYEEGKKEIPLWTKDHLMLKSITEYILAIGFAFQIGTLTLMQAFWSHLHCQMQGKPFIKSWKFKFYFGLVFASMIIFPLSRFLSNNNDILVANVPLFIFSIKLLVISFLGIKNGKRLNNLLKSIVHKGSSSRGQETIFRVHYFIEMNKLLTLGALLISIGFFIISSDAIFGINRINQSKVLMDLFMIHANFGSLILWCTMILIIYPRYYITGSGGIGSISTTRIQEVGSNKYKGSSNSFVVNMTTTTSSSVSRPTLTSSNPVVERSVTNLLEEQQQQMESYRHKTSVSISSTTTLASTVTQSSPNSPNYPSVPVLPPPIHER